MVRGNYLKENLAVWISPHSHTYGRKRYVATPHLSPGNEVMNLLARRSVWRHFEVNYMPSLQKTIHATVNLY